MVLHIISPDILLIACIFPRPFGARKNATLLAKYLHVLYAKPSIKIYTCIPTAFFYQDCFQKDKIVFGTFALAFCKYMC